MSNVKNDEPGKQLSPSIVGSIDFIAGSLGGTATVLVGQPLDTIKVKMQTSPQLYPSALKCLISTFKSDGVFRGLYAGTSPAIVANVAENSVLFCAYGACQSALAQLKYSSSNIDSLSPLDKALSGSGGAFFSSFTLCPTELIKCKLQSAREKMGTTNISAFKVTADIVKTQGIRGLFSGLTSTIAREMPGYFFFFGGYEGTKKLLISDPDKPIAWPVTIVSGGVGGLSLWLAIFPFDLVKSRIQVDNLKDGLIVVLTRIVRQEGVTGLYRGLGPTLVRTFPATGALFIAYEYSKSIMTNFFN